MNLKVRLAVMNFLEFAVWGAYLTSMGNYLGKAGMGRRLSEVSTLEVGANVADLFLNAMN